MITRERWVMAGGVLLALIMAFWVVMTVTAVAQGTFTPRKDVFYAQAPAPAAPAPPTLDKLDLSMLETVVGYQKRANEACNQLPQFKEFIETRDRAMQAIQARYPGYALDLSKPALVKTPAGGTK